MRASLLGCICGMALSLAGCAGTDLELEGGVFDLMGISGNALQASNKDPKVAARNPLVVPPRTDKLPVPGGQPAAPAAVVQQQPWPVDPETRKVAAAQAKADQHKAYCQSSVIKDGEAVRGDDWFDKLTGERARCPPAWGSLYEKKAGEK